MLSQDERRKYNLILSNGEQLFNRLNSDIYHLQSKNLSLTGFLIANLSIVVALIIFLFQKGWNPLIEGYVLMSLPIILIAVSLGISFKNFTPEKFLELDMFDNERFKEIIRMSEKEMYSDFIYHYKEAFKYNKNKYNRMVRDLKISLWIYLSAAIILLILVVVIIFWGM